MEQFIWFEQCTAPIREASACEFSVIHIRVGLAELMSQWLDMVPVYLQFLPSSS